MSTKENDNMVRGEKTTLTKANERSYSLRTTVPKGIAKQLDLQEGDSIVWLLNPSPDGKGFVVTVVPEHKKHQNKK